MGIVIDIGLYAGCGACALEAVTAYARLARTKDGHRDAGSWHAPLIFTSGTFALLGILGVLAPAVATVLAAGPLLAVLRIVWRAWREAAGTLGRAKATAIVLGGLLRRVREALWHTREDARELRGRLRPDGATPAAAAPFAPAAAPAAMAALRSVPSVLEDRNLGSTPAPAEVAADLEALGAMIPPPFQAVAEWMADFEPGDQDELEEHAAQEAAGWLTVAEAAGQRAETLLGVRKLHPAYVAGLLEDADAIADLASLTTMSHRRYHDVYGDVEDWHDQGNELPEDARNWGFGGGGAPAA